MYFLNAKNLKPSEQSIHFVIIMRHFRRFLKDFGYFLTQVNLITLFWTKKARDLPTNMAGSWAADGGGASVGARCRPFGLGAPFFINTSMVPRLLLSYNLEQSSYPAAFLQSCTVSVLAKVRVGTGIEIWQNLTLWNGLDRCISAFWKLLACLFTRFSEAIYNSWFLDM